MQRAIWVSELGEGKRRAAPRLGLGLLAIAILIPPVQAQTYTVLYTFTGGTDGGQPAAGVILDPAGSLLGTTFYGGKWGDGVVFKLDPTGKQTVLHSFLGFPTDGGNPLAGLLQDSAGKLYGTTSVGGTCSFIPFTTGCGVVFEVDSAGESIVYNFAGGADGAIPEAGLIRDPAGNLYGTTYQGGLMSQGCVELSTCGVIFKVAPSGKETVLYQFTGGADGGNPTANLILDREGNLYGTNTSGGPVADKLCPFSGNVGCGVAFKLDPAGHLSVLHAFDGADGANPSGSLVRDSAGNFYGTTPNLRMGGCGIHPCYGVVFKLDPAGNETVLHKFTGGDGATPKAGVILDPAGNLYGTTFSGGAFGFGVVFKVDPAGNETVLHSFTGGLDGAYPEGSLLLDSAGSLYGTASAGGATTGVCCGVVFKLAP